MDLETALLDLVDQFATDRTMSQRKAALYHDRLLDLPEADVVDAIWSVSLTSKFLPTVAEIREVVVERRLGLPSEDEAWAMVRACIQDKMAWSDLPKCVSAVQRAIGTSFAFRQDEKGVMETRFRKAYAEERKKAIGAAQSGAVPLVSIEAGASLPMLRAAS